MSCGSAAASWVGVCDQVAAYLAYLALPEASQSLAWARQPEAGKWQAIGAANKLCEAEVVRAALIHGQLRPGHGDGYVVPWA